MNFILKKSFTYCTTVHSYFEKGNKYISTYKSHCFKELHDFILSYGLDSPGLNRMGLKKDNRNDNLFFKRVTDIIIPDKPLSKN